MKSSKFLLLSAAALCGCVGGNVMDDTIARYTSADQDTTVLLGNDFYQFSNGGWIAQHPLPADKSRYGAFDILSEECEMKLKGLVEEASAAKAPVGSATQKISDLYTLGMDTVRRDKEGFSSMQQYIDLARSANFAKPEEFAKLLARLHRCFGNPVFNFSITPDYENSSMMICELWQSGISLPDRDYYFDESDNGKKIIAGYKSLISKVFASLNLENPDFRANEVFNFEKSLAALMNTRVENRDPQAICNTVQFEELAEKVPGFDWNSYFSEVGVEIKKINIGQPKYFGSLFDVVKNIDVEVLRDYLTFNTISSVSSYLSSDLYSFYFDFYSRQLRGIEAVMPLWKRVLYIVDNSLGEELGRLFVTKYFPSSSKKRMEDLIEQLRVAFGQRIDNLEWMSAETKAAAKTKLAAMRVKVGYPNKWKDYCSLNIDPSKSFVENIIAVSEFHYKKEIEKIYQPVDMEEWYMTPQTVNAYYNPLGNEIVFPAGILQPPFFYGEGDDAVNYGAIGVVIGHEMTHGFDDQGCQFDKDGNLSNWWSADDNAKFGEVTKALVSYFDRFTVVDSIKANGRLTLGENIADLGGLCISHQAFRNTLIGKDEPQLIDGQTAEQRFLLAYSRVWASAIRKEELVQRNMTDVHSCGRLRVNGPLPHLDFFYSAFGITESDDMYVPNNERIVIW